MSRTDAYKLIYYDVTRKLERIHVMKIGFSNKSNMRSSEKNQICLPTCDLTTWTHRWTSIRTEQDLT